MAWGSVRLYQTYDYIEHDNEFCLSCHLMVEPFERFARSAHRDLGCKACHRPTLATRSGMALTQILQNPDTLEAHAEVPNAVCVECHVDGDPEAWRNIANSAGHRMHLESEDSALHDVGCVECHSSSVHEFTATDQTCAQAGCHDTQDIRLGAMGALTIHCATCHTFNATVDDVSADSVQLALEPQREECLSCHAMRERMVDLPLAAEDPHSGMCGACHNPHDQTEPSEAFATCVECHDDVDTTTPFHRGLDPGVLEDCSRCHEAHRFHAEGLDCIACHTDPARPERVIVPLSAGGERTSLGAAMLRVLAALVLPARATAQEPTAAAQFDHARHTDVACTACHSMTESHGGLEPAARQCQACHHTTDVAQPCSRCHEAGDVSRVTYPMRRPYRPSVGRAGNRTLPFNHQQHPGIACGQCHIEGVTLSAARLNCSACHEEHHEADNDCIACHQKPPATAHTRTVHLTCESAGCHSPAPVAAADRTRQLCLGCHQDMTDHQPDRTCVNCHTLPPATPSSRGRP